MRYEFTNEDLKNWFYDEKLKEFNLIYMVKEICEINNLDFNLCSNMDIERSALYAPRLVFEYNIKNNINEMKEELKITGKGALHGKEFGTLKLNDDEKESYFKEFITPDNVKIKKIFYDPELKQYCVDGQWVIPFEYDSKIQGSLDDALTEIKELKSFFINNQSFEPASMVRDIQKTLINLKEVVSKLEEMRLKC